MANNKDWGQELYGKPLIKDNSSSQSGGLVKDAGGVLKSIGLGAIPDILGAGQFGVQKLLAGQNPFSAQGQTPQQLQQTTAGNQFIDPQKTGGVMQAGQDLAGGASWLVPETKLLKGGNILQHILGAGVNNAVRGGIQGGLGAVSQGQNPLIGVGQGAIAGPIIAGAGAALTDAVPRYIGFRNYGPAGKFLPEVQQAETAAKDAGIGNLDQARQNIMGKLQWPSDMTGNLKAQDDLMTKIEDLSKQSNFTGAPGISDLVKKSNKAFPQQVGELPNIESAIRNSSSPFDAYNRIKNMADWAHNTQGDKVASFIKSAAGVARNHIIDMTDNPAEAKKAMDLYAAQTAMNAGQKGNIISNILGEAGRGGPSADIGMAGIASLIPGLHGLAGIPLADYALTNPVTGPTVARGLVNAGQSAQNSGLAAILQRLGIAGAQNGINAAGQ